MLYNEVKEVLVANRTKNAYINGNERVRIVGLTEKMVKVNNYNGSSLVKNDKGTYVVKNVRPESISLTKEKVSKSNNKPRGVFQVEKNGAVIKNDLAWEKARELFKSESAKGVEADVFGIHKLVDGARTEKASMSKTIKVKASKPRANNYVVRVEDADVTELGGFTETLNAFKGKVTELTDSEEFETVVKMVKIDKKGIETISREMVITEPIVEEVTEPIAETVIENDETQEELVA